MSLHFIEINCDDLKSENNLLVRVASRTVGGIAEYTCPRGYFTIDNNTRHCLPKGSWSGRPPTCQSKIKFLYNTNFVITMYDFYTSISG